MPKVDLEKGEALRKLVRFVGEYYQLAEIHLRDVEESVGSLVALAMDGITRVSEFVDHARKHAENLMENVSFVPGEEAAQMMQHAQDSVDAIFSAALSENSDELMNSDSSGQRRRAGGKFSKRVEAISMLATRVEDTLMSLVGALSADDVIRQQLQNIYDITSHVDQSLGNLDRKPDEYFSVDAVQQFQKGILSFALNHYKSTEEKLHFRKVFHHFKMEEPPQAKPHRELAAHLITFLADMGHLLGEHVNHSNRLITETVDHAMAAIDQLNQSSIAGRKHADSALMQLDGKRVEKSLKEIEENEGNTVGSPRAFDSADQIFDKLSNDLERFMMELMGALSIDDVVQQRMDALAQCFVVLSRHLSEIASNLEGELTRTQVSNHLSTILEITLKKYRSKAERDAFEKIYPGLIGSQKNAAL